MDEGLKKQALEWFERGDHNIATAKMLLDNKWYTDAITYGGFNSQVQHG